MSLTLDILEMGSRGDGIAEEGGQRFFVPFALPGETVEAEPGDRRGEGVVCELLEVLSPSRHREIAPCVHFGTCGGCALQHWRRDIYSAWKVGQITQALAQRGVDLPSMMPALACEPAERRRADIVIRRHGRKVLAGFHERASQRIVDIEMCVVARPAIVRSLPILRETMASLLPDGGAADAVINETDTGLDVLLRPHKKMALTLPLREMLVALAERADFARVSWGGRAQAEPVATRRKPVLTFADTVVEPPPGAFLQATRRAEITMRAGVQAWSGSAGRVADLFAGIGALTLGRAGRLDLFESDESSVAAVDAAARRLGGNRVAAHRRDLFRNPLTASELAAYDAVVMDPPRAGAAAQSGELATSNVRRIVYGSCDPGSFARDARTLLEGGYRLEKLMPIDQFLWSAHVELLALFTK